MDIDFHYFATYAAARFAGLDGRRALTIATSAQMIDENALGVAGGSNTDGPKKNYFKKIPIKAHEKGSTLLDYQLIQSFQTVGDIPTTDNIAYKSYWPVFHFLPGNFKPKWGDKRLESPLWAPRTFNSQCDANHTQHRDDYFKWLTRPYSPMAIALINNCRDLVHDARSDINKFGLADYLIGVTMHVFIDTWAHQDFVGYTSKIINGAKTNPVIHHENTGREGKWDGTGKVGAIARWNEASAWLGHGPVGHWPDHSALIFDYMPGWSAGIITRNNPAEYEAAFVNMIHAMRCIVNNEAYLPISSDEALRRIPVGPLFNQANLNKIKGLISYKRNPDGEIVGASIPKKIEIPTGRDIAKLWLTYDAWDKNMYFFNSVWINTLIDIFQGVDDSLNDFPLTHWVPGKSEWVDQASSATKKAWLTPAEFLTLDYFKFNVAAKFHYRFVEQQLKAFGEELIGDWPVGFAYANDLGALEGAGSVMNKEKTDILGKLRDLQRTVVKADVREGLTVLIGEVQFADSGTEARAILHRGLSLVDARERSWSYGLITDDGNISDQKTVQTLRSIAGPIVADEAAVPKLRDAVNIALQKYKRESSGFFKRSSTESKAAEQRLLQLVATNDAELEDALNYLMGRTPLRPNVLRDHLDCRPIKSDGRLYKLLEEALRVA
ncbi:MAG: DUF6765 family protein [Methylococcaceae bacterium]|jgi:hypothetical protein